MKNVLRGTRKGDKNVIVKKRTRPAKLEVLEAAQRRLPPHHSLLPQIKEDYHKRLTGYQGEQQIDHYLSLLPKGTFFILNDLRLKQDEHYFQIDSLLLSREVAVILEVKNMTGTLLFDRKFNQLIRIIDGREKGFPDPFLQVENQRRHLKAFLKEHDFPVPVETLIIISQPETIIKSLDTGEDIREKVMQAAFLPTVLTRLKNKFPPLSTPVPSLEKILQTLIQSHTSEHLHPVPLPGLKEKDIRTGVQCPVCQALPMKKIHGKWFCLQCRHTSRDAHCQAIQDYLLLINPTISNRQCRAFLQVESRQLVSRLINEMQLQTSGFTAARVYWK